MVLVACAGAGCTDPRTQPSGVDTATSAENVPDEEVGTQPIPPEIEASTLESPVAVWSGGEQQASIEHTDAVEKGRLLLDLGEQWTPYILTDGLSPDGQPQAHTYRDTYLKLAAGEFPDDLHGDRARRDKYLELYGILPTLNLLRRRFEHIQSLPCASELDLEPLKSFEGFLAYRRGRRSQRNLERYQLLGPQMTALVQRLGHDDLSAVQQRDVSKEEWEQVEEYRRLKPDVEAIIAAQQRLDCEGYFAGREGHALGIFDWRTHEALAEFERRHRVYGWGFIGKETLRVLQMTPAEVEQEAVIRVLTERAIHAVGVVEDGSQTTTSDGEQRTFKNAKGEQVPLRNLEEEIRNNIIKAFGLQTPESTYAWLSGLGELPAHYVTAIPGIELPEYYSENMDFVVYVDRGDVWYEFPYDEEGKARSQPVRRRPRVTLYTKYQEERIPLAKFGTTVGGWRSEYVDGTLMWKYKGSPTGNRIWSRIVAAPVWVPPETTPPRSLLRKTRRGYKVNYYETGPGYASAYGLVAAYHRKYWKDQLGEIHVGGDEGIRTHGSVDYMSIMRRHSHGCHRMHNHLAVRLMSFVLKHRPHKRLGARRLNYEYEFDYEDQTYMMDFQQGGYIFELDEPLHVRVLRGRVRGALKEPVEYPLPKYDEEQGAYVMPDGSWVYVDRMGNLTPRPRPELEPPLDPFEEFHMGPEQAPGVPAEPTPAPVTQDEGISPQAGFPRTQVNANRPTATTVQ